MRTGGQEDWKLYLFVYFVHQTKGLSVFLHSARDLLMKDLNEHSDLLSSSSFLSVMCLYTGSLLFSPAALGRLQHQMSSCQRQSKSDKHTDWTSEESLAACSSAISARESSYKKHLLHFVLSMMLWKINTVMVCLPLLSLSVWVSVSICMHLNAHALPCSLYFCFAKCMCLGVRVRGCIHASLARVSGDNCIIICTSPRFPSPETWCFGQRANVGFPAALLTIVTVQASFHLLH